ncbi:hypothetical protein [Filimonas effusa]|uniref:Uncharacterized protein n=1 Tax=Filimonas effusa TaxID=2508721 RepID=A0A4Q1D9P6_9BACT|nr:hypothetical protein [Filimonas effusa]RXK85445.1 hypothetical protein ESB13_01065 [Filimonas effusa]
MKFAVATVLTALLGFTAPLFLPWWCFAVTSLVIAYTIHQKPLWAFVSGFTGLFLVWGVYAWFIDRQNGHILSQKIGPILKLGSSSLLLVIVTGLVAGLVSGMGALTGSFARK